MTLGDPHVLEPPTASDLREALGAVVGRDQAEVALRLAIRDALAQPLPADQLGPAQLVEVARALIRQRGVHAIIGRSFEIRALSYLELAPAEASAGPRSSPNEAETARLAELAALGLGDEIDDPALTALVERAATELELPTAALSIVLDSAQYFVASHGLSGWLEAARGTPDEWALCRRVVDQRAAWVVEDAELEPGLAANPVVAGDGLRCYLGVPLISRGQALGTLCVFGPAPRRFHADDRRRLERLAADIVALLAARRR